MNRGFSYQKLNLPDVRAMSGEVFMPPNCLLVSCGSSLFPCQSGSLLAPASRIPSPQGLSKPNFSSEDLLKIICPWFLEETMHVACWSLPLLPRLCRDNVAAVVNISSLPCRQGESHTLRVTSTHWPTRENWGINRA